MPSADQGPKSLFEERAREDAEGTGIWDTHAGFGSLEHEREEAEGVEVFEDPDATTETEVLVEGSPGHEMLAADSVDRATAGDPLQSDREDR